MKRKILLPVIIVVLLLIIIIVIFSGSKNETTQIMGQVKKGPFEVLVYTSGQLEAKSSVKILIPEALTNNNVRIWEIKITDLVEEGTVVDSGEYVGTLDHSAVDAELVVAKEEMETTMNEFEDAQMDSNLSLSNIRDQIVNAGESVEEMQIVLSESVYESPSVIRKAEMDLERAKRNLEQQKRTFVMTQMQMTTRVDRRKVYLKQKQQRVADLEKAYESLNIRAPKPGMVIYDKDRFGTKIQVGSTVSRWSPTIAILPDLSSMNSKTYVNEIDISKIAVGQKTRLGIDAFPEKELTGEVIAVANIGQPLPKSDAKVFEVIIRVFGSDKDLKPAMTTSNIIQTGIYRDTLFVPSDAIFSNDSMQYVFLKKGKIVKQIVDLGSENENYTVVKKGLQEGDIICLTEPAEPDNIPFTGYEIYDEIRSRDSLAVISDNEEKKTAEKIGFKRENKKNNPVSPDKASRKKDKIRKRG
jgi:HlyD family secretion protein